MSLNWSWQVANQELEMKEWEPTYSVLVVSSLLFLINEQVKYFFERSLSAVYSQSG